LIRKGECDHRAGKAGPSLEGCAATIRECPAAGVAVQTTRKKDVLVKTTETQITGPVETSVYHVLDEEL
jgi:hypothetical protein